jgi:hypothetical protein
MIKLIPSDQMFSQYQKKIRELPLKEKYEKNDLLNNDFEIFNDGNIKIYYGPFGQKKQNAKIVLVGITPGFTQLEIAIRRSKTLLQTLTDPNEIIKQTSKHASFAGSMRKNLISMLDEIKLNESLGIETCNELFISKTDFLLSTSALLFPTFVDRKNYTGHSPQLLKYNPFLEIMDFYLLNQLLLSNEALIIPLGKAVSEVLTRLIQLGKIDSKRVFIGFPHPSGANGHRKKDFSEIKNHLIQKVKQWNSSQ